jgi:hypothetical protein
LEHFEKKIFEIRPLGKKLVTFGTLENAKNAKLE